jgi:hypothetical protein
MPNIASHLFYRAKTGDNFMRKTTTIIVCKVRGYESFHFTKEPLQTRDDGDCGKRELWFPIHHDQSLFNAVESLLVTNGIAHNVTSINKLRACGNSVDYEVVYNETA